MLQIAANTANEESENAIYFMKGKVALESFLSWLENRIKNSSIQISHTFDNNSRMHTYVVKHDICENWSLYLKHIIEHIFNKILEKKVEVSISYTMLTFKFKEDRNCSYTFFAVMIRGNSGKDIFILEASFCFTIDIYVLVIRLQAIIMLIDKTVICICFLFL
jgi:hypothetical protein